MPADVRFIGLDAARRLLADRGIVLNDRQMRRATEPGPDGRRRLPFFRCPLTSRLICREDELLAAIASWGASDPPQAVVADLRRPAIRGAADGAPRGASGAPNPPQTRHNKIRAALGYGGFPRV